jgi:hypothetical protein
MTLRICLNAAHAVLIHALHPPFSQGSNEQSRVEFYQRGVERVDFYPTTGAEGGQNAAIVDQPFLL